MKKAIQDRNAQSPSGIVVTSSRIARADLTAEQAGDQKAEQRKEDDQMIHARLNPSAR